MVGLVAAESSGPQSTSPGMPLEEKKRRMEHESALRESEVKMQQLEQQRPPPPPMIAESPATDTNVRCGPEATATLRANDPANQRPSTDTQIPFRL